MVHKCSIESSGSVHSLSQEAEQCEPPPVLDWLKPVQICENRGPHAGLSQHSIGSDSPVHSLVTRLLGTGCNRTITFSSSETQGQSVWSGERVGRKFSSTGERAPGYRLSPSYFQKFQRMLAPDWAQKMLCIIMPNRQTVSPEFFSWVRTRRLLSLSRLVWLMHQRMHAVRKLSVWYKIPIWFQNTVCPKTKDTFPKIQAWAYNRYSHLHLSLLA